MMLVEKVDGGITRYSKAAGLILVGWFACAIYHRTEYAAKVERVLPAIQAEAGCEHWRADKSVAIAKQAIVGANSETAPIPPASAIPRDCAHPVIPKP